MSSAIMWEKSTSSLGRYIQPLKALNHIHVSVNLPDHGVKTFFHSARASTSRNTCFYLLASSIGSECHRDGIGPYCKTVISSTEDRPHVNKQAHIVSNNYCFCSSTTMAFASSVSYPPHSYGAICTSVPRDSIQCKPPAFSFLQSKQKCLRHCAVLSCIREIVSSANFTPVPAAPFVKASAAALPAAEFSILLQTRNIEDHTALYWAIVNNRRKALLEFVKFIFAFSPAWDTVNPEDKSLRRMLGCRRDDVQVHERDGVGESYFYVHFVLRMFQKRLRITQELKVEFVARGRIWVLYFYMRENGKWYVEYRLAEHSSPVHPIHAELQIKANKPPPGSHTPKYLHLPMSVHASQTLVSKE
ncbi:hypothetical protein BDR04DRAFT_1158556 [Suillus decipiens]|nr:hypothetical protein BDR04DRAFT_1158556 [Suillus decipiens]